MVTPCLKPFSRHFQQSRGRDARVPIPDGFHRYSSDWIGHFQGKVDAFLRAHSLEPMIPARRWCPVLDAPQPILTLAREQLWVRNKRCEARSYKLTRGLGFSRMSRRCFGKVVGCLEDSAS